MTRVDLQGHLDLLPRLQEDLVEVHQLYFRRLLVRFEPLEVELYDFGCGDFPCVLHRHRHAHSAARGDSLDERGSKRVPSTVLNQRVIYIGIYRGEHIVPSRVCFSLN